MLTGTMRIKLLGGFALEGVDDAPSPVLPQRRAEAVLAVLAVSGSLGCERERLLALLWPELDDGRARHHLRDAVYALRSALGRGAVLSTADSLRLQPELVRSDVEEFELALGAARLEDAVALYRGPLLDGFHVSAALEFERWLDAERSRFCEEYLQALKRLAKRAEQGERWDEAAGWWRRVVAADPYNSRAVIRLTTALARAGDRANALQAAEVHCRRLREELEMEPDPAFVEEMERLREGPATPPVFFTPVPASALPEP